MVAYAGVYGEGPRHGVVLMMLMGGARGVCVGAGDNDDE